VEKKGEEEKEEEEVQVEPKLHEIYMADSSRFFHHRRIFIDSNESLKKYA